MLPSLGCFSALECPFFKGGAGQCSRPYCHYRHVKRDPNAPPEPTEDILGPLPVVEKVKVGDASTSQDQPPKSRAPMYRAIVDAAPTYNPTPIAILKSSHLPIPYTPTAPTRSSVVKKSKPSLEYVPHCKGSNRASYPPYCPSSISSLNTQTQNPPLDDPLKNPLYEIYGPEGAQFSPNDVEPSYTGYSYAPSKNASYAPYSPQYVPCPAYTPQFSPPDSQPSDDDDNVDLAVETAAQTNGDPGGGTSIIDIDLSELDNLEFEFEDDDDVTVHDIGGNVDDTVSKNCDNIEKNTEAKGNGELPINADERRISDSLHLKSEKRRSSGSSSSVESKRLKSSHEEDRKRDHKEKKHLTSSTSKKSSSHDRKSSSHSSNKSKSSSKSQHSSSSKSRSSTHKKSHSSDSKSKSESSSKHRDDKERDKERSKDKHGDRDKSKHKEKDGHTEKHRKKSSHRESSSKDKSCENEINIDQLDEEIRMVEAELDASLEDEDTIEQQCYEMFSEFSEAMQHKSASNTQDERVRMGEEPVSNSSSRKRIAHQASHSGVEPPPKVVPTLAQKCSPYQAMRDRWELLKKSKLQSIEDKPSLAVAPQNIPRPAPPAAYSATNNAPASLPSLNAGKKKIASVPNVSRYLKPPAQAANDISSASAHSGTAPSRFYVQGTQKIDEFGRLVKVRVAHSPNMDAPAMKKPVVNPSECRKFKPATRQANVNKLFQAYLDAGFGVEAHNMALESERTSTQGTECLGVYSHRIIQILKDLRACAESSQNGPKLDGLSGIPNRVVSHSAMLAGKLGSKVSWSIETSKKETEAKVLGQSLYEQLVPYVLTKEQLEENGFPMPSGEKGVAILKPGKYRYIQQPPDPRQRICVRCLKLYSVDKRGNQIKDEECFYHSGRKFTTRRYREAETRYTCCDGTGGFCSVGSCHVFETSAERKSGYMSTLPKSYMDDDPGVYALDCEMCYTTGGLELTRVTVIKEDLSIAYETLVKPANKIIDYNTRFSGITEKDLKDVKTNIIQVQATLLGMFCDKSILIGHSLESDLKALKLIHPTIVDTSVVFPHKMGPPMKRSLRTLAADFLKKIIQNEVDGHDSKEDAATAMELMLWKLKEDEKTR